MELLPNSVSLANASRALFGLSLMINCQGIRTFAEELLSSAVVPDCLASLHVVKFEEINGEDHELLLAKFFMENGMILESMCFSAARQILDKYEMMQEFKEKLYLLNFNSVVEFSYE